MEETAGPTPEYIKGFNEGYMLTKEASALSDKLSRVKGNSERIKGFHDGRRQFVLDKVQEQRKSQPLPSRAKEERTMKKKEDFDREK